MLFIFGKLDTAIDSFRIRFQLSGRRAPERETVPIQNITDVRTAVRIERNLNHLLGRFTLALAFLHRRHFTDDRLHDAPRRFDARCKFRLRLRDGFAVDVDAALAALKEGQVARQDDEVRDLYAISEFFEELAIEAHRIERIARVVFG